MSPEPRPGGGPRRDVDGIVLLDKPAGLSSNQALQRIKSLFRARKAGHTGSLDPLATGMLPVCLGEATKMAGYLLGADKTYRVQLAFGLATATGDSEGATVARGPERVSAEALEAALADLRGPGLQVPPMYSALKVNGQPLYRLARAGAEVVREPRSITIHALSVEAYDPHRPILRVHCSKGTYVRTLVQDIAARAGTVAHVVDLRRLAVAPFLEGSMHRLSELERVATASVDALFAFLIPADQAMAAIPAVCLGVAEAIRIVRGQGVGGLEPADGSREGLVRLYAAAGRFLGVGQRAADGRIRPLRLMRTDRLDGPA